MENQKIVTLSTSELSIITGGIQMQAHMLPSGRWVLMPANPGAWDWTLQFGNFFSKNRDKFR